MPTAMPYNKTDMDSHGNICKFVPKDGTPADIDTVNFVLETRCDDTAPHIRAVYAVHLVTNGKGVLTRGEKQTDIEKGDVFFTSPGTAYSIKSSDGLQYAYVSFLGLGATSLLSRIDNDLSEAIYKHNDALADFWLDALYNSNPKNIDLISRSVLEYSVSRLINSAACGASSDTVAEIKKYIDSRISDAGLSLKTVAALFGYNEKYLSKLFYRYMGVRFGDYITELRMRTACGLMECGRSCIKEIAFLCGYTDPLYFSKVFKSRLKCSPTVFLARAGHSTVSPNAAR